MKSVRLSFRKKFDDQYTFDLQNNVKEHRHFFPPIVYVCLILFLTIIL